MKYIILYEIFYPICFVLGFVSLIIWLVWDPIHGIKECRKFYKEWFPKNQEKYENISNR